MYSLSYFLFVEHLPVGIEIFDLFFVEVVISLIPEGITALVTAAKIMIILDIRIK